MDIFETFLLGCRTQSYRKGEVILIQDDLPDRVYTIKRGIVKTYNLTPDGEEKSILFSLRGDTFPLIWVFDKTARAIFYKEAYTDCELYVFEKQKFLKLLKNSPELVYTLLDKQVSISMKLAQQINALEQSRAYTKILSIFHYLCLWYGQPLTDPA